MPGNAVTLVANYTQIEEEPVIETIPLSQIPIGVYIAYNPVYEENGEEVNTVTVLGTDAGTLDTDNVTGIDQTFSLSGYTDGWKVLYNDGNQLTLISAESVGNLTLGTAGNATSETASLLNGGKIGYAKAIYTLNKMCNDYAKGEYAVSGRAPGYSDVKPGPDNLLDEMTLADMSHTKLRELIDDTTNSLTWPYYPYGDEYNYTETNWIKNTQDADGNYVLRHSSGYVWLASRVVTTGSNYSYFGARNLGNTGDVGGNSVYRKWSDNDWSVEAHPYGVRPVITLESRS